MRRIDAIAIALGVFAAGGAAYGILRLVGVAAPDAGLWSQALLVLGLLGWLVTYLLRVLAGRMTYHQQLAQYREAVLRKRLEEMSPEELAQLQAEIEAERQSQDRPEAPAIDL